MVRRRENNLAAAGQQDVRRHRAMKYAARHWARLRQARGQSMAEYALVIAGVAIVALFTGYQQIGTFIVATLNKIIGF